MQIVIDKNLTPRIIKAAEFENKSPEEYVDSVLRETLQKIENRKTERKR